jgi:regulator of RNase E activity RraB
MKPKSVEDIISGHEVREASLRNMFLEKKLDLRAPRSIECHFWTWSEEGAVQLADALKSRGFEILVQQRAGIADDPDRWNLEVAIKQSIDLTMRREFIEDLVRLAGSYDGLYDGWGTRI